MPTPMLVRSAMFSCSSNAGTRLGGRLMVAIQLARWFASWLASLDPVAERRLGRLEWGMEARR